MKRSLISAVVLLSLIPLLVQADEQEAKATEKPLIFIDTNSWFGPYIDVNTGFSTFVSLAREQGYEIDHGKHTEINREQLKGISVYILAAPTYSLLDRDKIALREFIQEGGTVILFDWLPFLTSLNSFIESYDVEFFKLEYGTWEASVPPNSPLKGPYTCNTLKSVNRLRLHILDNSNVITAARYDDGAPLMVIPTHKHLKKGKLIISGDIGMFAKDPGNIELADNKAFIKNLLVYIKGNYDLAVLLAKHKGNNLTSGDTVTAICKIKNVGESTSDETKVRFYLREVDSLDAGPAAALTPLKTVTLQALAPGKRKKIKVKVKLPNRLAPGSYILIAQVDPDGTSNDTDTSNNIKASKKEMIVN